MTNQPTQFNQAIHFLMTPGFLFETAEKNKPKFKENVLDYAKMHLTHFHLYVVHIHLFALKQVVE